MSSVKDPPAVPPGDECDECYSFEHDGGWERSYGLLLPLPVEDFTPQDFWDFFTTCPHLVTVLAIEGEYSELTPNWMPDPTAATGLLARLVLPGSDEHRYGPLHPMGIGVVAHGEHRDAIVAKIQSIVDEFRRREGQRFVVGWQLYGSSHPHIAHSRDFAQDTATRHLISVVEDWLCCPW